MKFPLSYFPFIAYYPFYRKLFSSIITKKLVYYFAAGRFFKYASKTLSDVLDELNIDNKELRAISHMYAFVGIQGTTESLELRQANIWSLPADRTTFDLDDMCNKYYDDPQNGLPDGEMLLFMGFPSAKIQIG